MYKRRGISVSSSYDQCMHWHITATVSPSSVCWCLSGLAGLARVATEAAHLSMHGVGVGGWRRRGGGGDGDGRSGGGHSHELRLGPAPQARLRQSSSQNNIWLGH
eukprot:SAG25_NODE_1106_length_3951_cov_2.250260_3_plen_105_part_00